MKIGGWVEKNKVPTPVSSIGIKLLKLLYPIGELFLRLIKMIIVPLVFASLLEGVSSLGNIKKLGRLGGKTLVYFLFTTRSYICVPWEHVRS